MAWFALVPIFISIRGKAPTRAFREGLVTGLIFNFFAIYWVTNTMFKYGGLPYAAGMALLIALSLYLALYFGAFAWSVAFVCGRTRVSPVLFAPLAWTALELTRNYLLSGFPWNLLGYSQAAYLPVIQVSDITGVYGVSALVVLANAAISEIAKTLSKKDGYSFTQLKAPLAASLVVVAVLGYGYFRLSHMPKFDGALKVAVVQGNIEQAHKWDPDYRDEVFGTYSRLTLEAAALKPDLIIWPETATPFYYQDDANRARLEGLARESGTYLMAGSPSFKEVGRDKYIDYNSAYLLSPDGGVAGRYDKMHLVPFGEYVPLGSLLPFVSKMVTSIGDFGRGTDYTVLQTPKGSFGTAICFEVIFPELVRMFPLKGAGFLTSITNDAWFGRSAAPYQHFNMAILRAVENRRALVRAANTGISGIIMPTGAVAQKTKIFTTTFITGGIPVIKGLTFYTRYGDVFAYLCAISAVLLMLVAFKKRRV